MCLAHVKVSRLLTRPYRWPIMPAVPTQCPHSEIQFCGQIGGMIRSSVFDIIYRVVASAEDRAIFIVADLGVFLSALPNRAHLSATDFFQRSDASS
jgi:hypothetical protein